MPNTCAGPGTRSPAGGVRAKNSGSVALSAPDSRPPGPNSDSHSARCQACSGSFHPDTSRPLRHAVSMSGRENEYSSSSSASCAASCARRRSSAVAIGVAGFQVAAHRRQLRRGQAIVVVEQRQQRAFQNVAVDDVQVGRAGLRDVAQEAPAGTPS